MAGTVKKGKPSDEGKSKGQIKDVKAKRVLDLEREEIYRERYTDGEDEPGENLRETNPNRNPNKGRRE